MTGNQIRQQYLDFFEKKGHRVIPPAPIVPPNDPTTLFTSSGMQQLVPYLKGETHPMGTRLVDSQPCFRSEDIGEVGDNRHITFFEMLGNWSLGDYFKAEQLPWFWLFITDIIKLPKDRIWVTIFSGDPKYAVPSDEESRAIWLKLGVPDEHILAYDAHKNWWSRAGIPGKMPVGEIGGPDSEVFYEFTQIEHNPKYGEHCHPNCDCGRFLEIGNSVFMQYLKTDAQTLVPLTKQNVDFGGGLERLTAAASDNPDIFTTDLFAPIIHTLEQVTGADYQNPAHQPALRIVADHLKGAVFLISGGVTPANKLQGYFLRRLLRRVTLKLQSLTNQPLTDADWTALADSVTHIYNDIYFPKGTPENLVSVMRSEAGKFNQTLTKGLNLIHKTPLDKIDGQFTFDLYQTYGFPLELTEEILKDQGLTVDHERYAEAFKKHQEQSRTASKGLFKGGLAGGSETIVKYHTATHLLHQALRDVLGPQVEQMGSNITAERLRFDFKHPQKLTDAQKREVEAIVNAKISQDLPVTKTIEAKETAIASGARAFFREKYPDQVSVYTIGLDPKAGWYSKELCGGPHVSSTGSIGPVKIKKEEAVGAGLRRIYMVLAS